MMVGRQAFPISGLYVRFRGFLPSFLPSFLRGMSIPLELSGGQGLSGANFGKWGGYGSQAFLGIR